MLTIEPWDESGFEILIRANTPEMTEHLGGPESDEKVLDRHQRYLRYALEQTEAWAFRVLFDDEPVGSIGYWDDETAFEMGWAILPEFHGRGFAREGVGLALDHAAANPMHDSVVANPAVTNLASNAVARSAGFTLHGEHRIEYPPGQLMQANLWVYDLSQRRSH